MIEYSFSLANNCISLKLRKTTYIWVFFNIITGYTLPSAFLFIVFSFSFHSIYVLACTAIPWINTGLNLFSFYAFLIIIILCSVVYPSFCIASFWYSIYCCFGKHQQTFRSKSIFKMLHDDGSSPLDLLSNTLIIALTLNLPQSVVSFIFSQATSLFFLDSYMPNLCIFMVCVRKFVDDVCML